MAAAMKKPGNRTSLPPELDSIDLGWGEDEAPTRGPKDGPMFLSEAPTAPRNVKVHVPIVEDEDVPPSERVTAPPPPGVPSAAFDQATQHSAAPDPQSAAPNSEEDIFDRPTLDGTKPEGSTAGFEPVSPPSSQPSALPPSEAPTLARARTAPEAPFAKNRRAPPWDRGRRDQQDAAAFQDAAAPREMEAQQDAAALQGLQDPAALQDAAAQHEMEAQQDHGADSPDSERSQVRDIATKPVGQDRILDLDEPEPLGPTPSALRDMKDRFAMGDFSGALESAQQVLESSPENLEARSMASKCREVLHDMYSSRIGGFEQTVSVVMAPDQIRWLSLDHRAGFLLSMIDGVSSVDDLLDVCGMPRLEAMRILCNLLDQKVVALS